MASSSVQFRNPVTSGWGEARSALRLPRLMLLLAVLLAGLGFSSSAYAQATVSWDYMSVSATDHSTGGSLSNGDSVDIGTTVSFFFYFFPGWTYSSPPSGCNIVHVSDDHWQGTITETCHIAGNDTPITIISMGSPEVTVGDYYWGDFDAIGGVSDYSYTLESGILPAGMTFSGGTLSGMPSEEGTFTYTVRATNEYGHTQTQSFTLTVNPAAAAPTANPVSATVAYGSNNNPITLDITGGPATSVNVATAPANGSANATGVSIAYTPTLGYAGPDSFTYTATNASGISSPATVTVTVSTPTITYAPTNPPPGTVDSFYNQSIAGGASGGAAPYTYAHASGTMVPGLTLAANGTLIGTPTTAGTFTFGVVATDSSTGTGPFDSPPANVSVTIVQDQPTITSISPDTGPMAGGTPVTITGANLAGATGVTFGGVAATSYTVDSDTQIRAVTPAGSAGAVDVAVTAPGGTVTETGGFTYATAAPNVLSVTTMDGTYTAGESILINVNFDDAVVVSGNPRLQVDIGGTTRYADYDTHGGVVVRFRYVAQAGDLAPSGIGLAPSISLNGGTIESTGGTAANLTLNGIPDLSGGVVDAVAPTAISSTVSGSPAPDATTVGFDVTFSEQVNGVDPSDFVLTTTGSAAGTAAGIGTTDGVTYHVNVTGISGTGSLRLDVLADGSITDLAGNPMTVAYTSGAPWARRGSADATLASLVPSAGALNPAFNPAMTGYDVTVDNATDGITLTPTAAEANATITVDGQTVASGSASPQIALAIGTTAIPVVVTAADGTTTRTYIVTVTRTASADATLSGLVPSAGTLNPAFSTDTLDYAVAVANAIDSLTLTPTADDANATIVIDGQSVASGSASQAIALSVGSTVIQVMVTAEDGMTAKTYAVTIERAQPVPTVNSRAIEINAGETASVDLTEGASGSPFTNAAIVDLSNAEAGTARIERDGQSYRLVFASSSTYTGGADIRFTLSNATGTSAPGTIAFTILGRPDPSQDPEVIGLLTAQVDAAKRVAQVQTRNFNDRLEQLHDEGDRRRNSMNLRLGYNAKEKPGNREPVESARETPGLLGYAPQDVGGSGSGAFTSDDKAASTTSADNGGMDLGPYAIWTGGYINFGESDNGGLDLDHTMVGVSGGIDYRFSQKFIAGFGVGFGRDRTDVGANGTQSTSHAYSAAVYGSYKPSDNFFIDGLVGGSWLDFDSRRYVTATGDFATGNRPGHQVFGSLTAAYEFRDETWLVSPYGRVELSRTWLDGFSEEGGGGFGLRYGNQSIDTVSGVIGLRAQYAFKTSWGSLKPGARVEYTHDFAGSSRINIGYIDLDQLPYWLDVETSNRSYMTLGLSLEAQLPQDWTLEFDYRTAFGSDQRDHVFGLEISKRF